MALVCKWKKSQDGWKLWKKGKPKVCGEGPTFEVAKEALDKSMRGNGISVLENGPFEFHPPLPPAVEAEKYMIPELYLISGGCEQFDCLSEQMGASFFEGGYCTTCWRGVGKRTELSITCTSVSNADAAYTRVRGSLSRSLYSEDFLSLLTPEEKDRFVFRPISFHERCNKNKCNYFELDADHLIPFVGIKEYESDGLTCRTCGHQDIRIFNIILPIPRYRH